MDNNQLKVSILMKIEEIKGKVSSKNIKHLNLDLLIRIINRLYSFSCNCDECIGYLKSLKIFIDKISDASEIIEKSDFKDYQHIVRNIISHLRKSHKLVTEGYYTGIYMSIGIAFGIPLGFALGNTALGIPIGICLGIAVGTGVDADTKKKELVI